MRQAPKVVDLGPRYEEEEGRSSVVPLEERQGEHMPTRLSLGQGWALIRTPSSENGIFEYYRVLLDRPPEPDGLLEWLRALHLGKSMRFEVLASIANSDEAKRRGLTGPGVKLINLAAALARRSGIAGRVKRRRFQRALVEMLDRSAANEGPSASIDQADLERRVAEIVEERTPPAPTGSEDVAELVERIAALEAAMLDLLNARARELRRPAAGGRAAGGEPPLVTARRA